MASSVVAVVSGTDDYTHTSAGVFTDATVVTVGNLLGVTQHMALRFVGVPIPQAATVSSAVITFDTVASAGTVASAITCVAEDNAAAASDDASCAADDLVRTAASTVWGFSAVSAGALVSANFAASVQKVVDRPSWSAGNALLVHIADAGSAVGVSQVVGGFDHLTLSPASLTVEWQPPSRSWYKKRGHV